MAALTRCPDSMEFRRMFCAKPHEAARRKRERSFLILVNLRVTWWREILQKEEAEVYRTSFGKSQ
jgi:hypothetical protein